MREGDDMNHRPITDRISKCNERRGKRVIGFSLPRCSVGLKGASGQRPDAVHPSRSASAFSQTLRETPARLAAALYLSRSPEVTLTFIRTLAGSLEGGLPLGFLALVIGPLCTHN